MAALTSESLPNLLKLDKNQFIHSYLQGQRAHAKFHAEEGRSLSTSWERDVSTPKKPLASGSHNVGFATPILTARISRAAADQEGSKKENIATDKDATRTALPAGEKTQPTRPSDKPDNTPNPRKSVSKKRGADSHLDEDQVARLAERRERKRVKRAIVQPQEPSEPDTASSDGNKKKKKGAKGKAKKPKVPAGLALMHGFTATNVGKNRLTLKPPSNVGVFKKGKASLNTKIKSKPKGRQAKHFSESYFLNNTKKGPEQALSDSSSDSDGDSTATSVEVPEPKKKVTAPKSRPVKTRTLTTKQPSEVLKVSASEKRPRVESEIWDIESRASEKRKLLGQQPGSIDERSAVQVQETVVMDARIPAWSNRVVERDLVQPAVEAEVADAIHIPSSPSLRPSQSASQLGQLLLKPSHMEAASKYFLAQRQPIPPPEPAANAVNPVSSLVLDPEPVECYKGIEPRNPLPPSATPNNFVPPARFILPVRTRVFAEQFLSVQAGRSHSEDSYIHSSLVDPPVMLENAETLDHYTWEPNLPDMLPESPELDYDYEEDTTHWYSEGPINGDGQLSDYGYPQPGVWDDTGDADLVLNVDGLEAGPYNDGGLNEFSVQYEDALECPEYMDPVEGRTGHFEPAYGESDFGSYAQYDPGDPVSNAEFCSWVTANSGYSPDCDYFMADAQGTGNDFAADAPNLNGQEFFASPVQDFAVADDAGDIISECTESVGAYTPHFAQGRALLLGLPPHEFADRTVSAPPQIPSAEVDVVKSLRGHWLPQRL
ncbi:hypothetical protein K438DRAFT_1826821 [Mycena galopus ATCC 62051]|nr:hypothetical protein K438DRAFT_1826821 [Mycena galopus ATCC 62051]